MKVLNQPQGDVEDSDNLEGVYEGTEDDDDANPLDDTQRSVKLMLRSKTHFKQCIHPDNESFCSGGVIPDSTMIHAARKRRQMAREMGVPGDYMSLNTPENGADGNPNVKSRLVRYETPFFFLFHSIKPKSDLF